METVEATAHRPSGLRPPSRAFGLQEISESQSNTRAAAAKSTLLAPPQASLSSKRMNSEFPQPDAKQRKTLAERGGECYGTKQNVAATPAPSRQVKASSIVGLASGIRPPSAAGMSALAAAKAPATSAASRQPAKSSYAFSVGPGARPPAAGPSRQQPSSFAKSISGAPRGTAKPRPVTAFGAYEDIEEASPAASSQQNGTKHTLTFSSQYQRPKTRPLEPSKLRGVKSTQSLGGRPTTKRKDRRESSLRSLVDGVNRLHISNDEDVHPTRNNSTSNGDQAASNLAFGTAAPGLQDPLDGFLEKVTVRQKSGRVAQPRQLGSPPQLTATGDARLVAPPPPSPPKTPTCGRRSLGAMMQTFEGSIKACRQRTGIPASSSPTKSRPPFLTKEANIRNLEFKAWDVDERLNEVESQWKAMKEVMNMSMSERKAMEQVVELANSRAKDLEKDREKLDSELAELRQQVHTLTLELETERRGHKFELDGQAREHKHELERLRREVEDQTARAQRSEREAVEAAERRFRAQLEDERARDQRQLEEVRAQLGSKQQETDRAMREKDRDIDEMRSQVERLKGDLDREVTLKEGVQKAVIELTTANLTLEAQIQQLTGKVRFLESSNQQQSDSFNDMETRLQEALAIAEQAREKLMKEETERRVLFNKYQELKGNIRVMCRVRPVLDASEGAAAALGFPDHKTSAQLDVTGPEERSATGNVSRKTMPFEFDRVFTPQTQNEEIFGEISQLVQSALDGYNVCIFCYGQTGSGKTFTMSSADGMIPRAVHMIYDEAERLRDKSWSYQMVGSFIEVYNEELHDLLAPEGGRKKLSIQHDDVRKQTTVVNCRTVPLDSAGRVEQMLDEAQSNRSVAATKANERSSRSHSVFILKLVGENSATGERCEGTLNLVDLAGSERLKHSQVEGDRMRETQNINKSLSCLGDVIEALGKGQGHVPYRNSKLTHLLQYSLGGNSKTLMFVMVSPLEAHLKETITSLRFATKVHNTHIGTAKSTKKLREHRDST